MKKPSRLQPLGLALCLALAYPVAQGLPQGAQVVQGQAKVSTSQPGQGLIQQASDKAVINWQSFSIGASETLRIEQPGVSSVLLNRVIGGDPSLILGRMQSNGQVFLLNPHGIVFGRGSQVDVGGLVASTLDLSDTAFLAGNYRFSAGPGAGGLQADGSITAPGGTVALVAPQLSVGGSIQARRVGLGAASTVQVDVEGDGLVLFNLRNDDDRDVALKFSGRIQAEGSAELRAQARAGVAGQVLNMDGIVQARGLRQQGGRIVIDGGTVGDTLVKGSLDASGETGGSISVLGQRVALLDAARLDASGRTSGGDIQVGGGFHGEGAAHNAERTVIAAGAQVRADATEQGNGGRVAVWAEQRTDMLGQVSARGGRLGGNGGMVETSGRQQLNMPSGSVDVSAPRGRAGQWLLDPHDLKISTDPSTADMPGTSPFTNGADSSVLNVGVLNGALAGGATVTVQTSNGGPQSGNISVEAAIVPAGASTLNMIAHGGISFSGAGAITAGATALNVSLQANSGGVSAGPITTGGTLGIDAAGTVSLGAVSGGALSINSHGNGVTLPTGSITGTLGVTTGGGNVTQTAGGLTVSGAATLTTGAGSVTLDNFSSGNLGITATNAAIQLGAGTITGTLNASSGGGAITQAAGGLTVTSDATISAGAGGITLGTFSSGNLGLTTANAGIVLGAGTVTGTLTANSAGGNITQAGALTVTSDATLSSGAGSVTLGSFNSGNLGITATNAAVRLGTGTVTGTLNANSGGGAITQAGGGLTVTSDATLTSGAGGVTLGTFSSGNLAITATNAGIVLGAGTVTGTLSANSNGGAITQAGALTVTGAATLTAGANSVTLGTFNSGNLGVTTTNSAIQLGAGTVTGTLTAHSGGGAISQAGALTVTSTSDINAGAAGGITLTAANHLQDTVDLTGGSVQVTNAGAQALKLGTLSTGALTATTGGGALQLGTGTVTGTLQATSNGGNITQAGGGLTVTSDATLTAGAGSVTLGTFSSGNLGITTTNAGIVLGAGTVTGTLTANSGGGAITQAGALTVTGDATLTSGTGGVTLGTFSSGNLGITATNAGIVLGAGTVTGTLTANSAGGAITQAGALTVTGDAALTAGANSVTLGTFSSGNLGITTTNGAIQLGAGTVTGTLTAHSGGGAISQAGALTVTGTSDINAGAAGGITLTAANHLQDTVDLTGGTTLVTNAGAQALKLGTLNTGALTATTGGGALQLGAGTVAGTLSATSNGGNITQSGALTVNNGATLSAGGGSVTLGSFNSGNLGITTTSAGIQLGTGTITGTLNANSGGGAITQAGGGLTVTSDATLSAGAGGITLGTFSSGNLGLTTANAGIVLGAGTVTGTLTANSGGGNITQAGALTVTSDATLTSGAGSVTLGSFSSGNLGITATNAAIRLGTGTVTGTLNANSGGGAITQAGGGLTVTSDATLTSGAGGVTLGSFSSGNLGITATNAGIVLGAGTVTGTLNANSNGGAITQAGALTVTGDATLTGGAGSITLGSFNSANLGLTTTGAAIRLGTGTVTGALNANSGGGAITQAAGGLTVTSDATIAAGAGGVTLGTFSSGNLDIATTNAGIVLGAGTVTGTLTANSGGGNITQAGALTVTGDATLTSGAGSVTLGSFNSGNLGITTTNAAIRLGTGTITGTLNAASGGGAITQAAGGVTVTGAATLDAGSGDITLTDANNHWNGVTLTGNSLDLRSAGNLSILGLTQPANHALTLSAGGNLSLGATTDIDTGTADLSLTSLGGSFTAGGKLAGKNISLTAQTGLTLGHDITATGTLGLTTTSGGVNQTAGSIKVTGVTTVAAGNSTVSLAQAGNRFQQAVNLTSGATTVVDSGALTLGTLNTGNLTVTSHGALDLGQGTVGGTLNATSTGNAITQTGGLTLTGATTLNAGTAAITLNQPTNDLQGAITATGGAVSLRSAHDLNLFALTQPANQALVLVAGDTLFLPAGTTNIDTGTAALTLSSLGGPFATFGTLKGGNVTLAGQSVTLSHDVTASGNLVVQSTTGTINQTAGRISVVGTSQFDAGTRSITLTRALNDFQGAVTLTGGTTQITSLHGLVLANLTTGALQAQAGSTLRLGTGTVGGNLNATSSGAMTQASGGLSVTGTSTFNAGSGAITLTDAANAWTGTVSLTGGATQFRSTGAVVLGGGTTSSLVLTSGGAVSQSAAIGVTGALTVNAGGAAINLSQASNQLGGTVTLTGGATQVRSNGALTLGTLSTAALTATSAGALNLGQGSIGGNLVASSGGGTISQSGALNVTGTANLQAGGGSITLNQGSNLWGGALSLGGGPVQVISNGSLTLGSLAVGSLSVDANGALNLGSGTVGGNLAANSHGGTLSQGGALSVAGTANLQAGGGSIVLTQGGNQWGGAVQITSGNAQISSAGALTLGQLATGNLSATAAGALDLGQGNIAGDLAAVSGGNPVTQSGALQVSGGTTVNAGVGNITLTNSGNQFLGALNLTGNAVALYNQPSLNLGTLSFNSLDATSAGSVNLGSGSLSGALIVHALGGAITQSPGGLTVGGDATLQASQGITLTDAANRLQGTVNLSGTTTVLANATDLRLGTLATGDLTLNVTGKLDLGAGTVGGKLAATSTGAVTQTGALVVNGAASINAGHADITLGQAGNKFTGAVDLRGGNVLLTSGGALSLGSLGVADLTVSSLDGLQLGTGTVGGQLKATSSNGAITQASGGLAVTGNATLSAAAGGITLDGFSGAGLNATTANGAISLGNSNFTGAVTANSNGGAITLNTGRIAGMLTANSGGGAITQAAGGLAVGGATVLNAGTASIQLADAGNAFTGTVSLSGGDVSLASSSALNLGSFTTRNFQVIAGGDLDLGTGSINGELTATTRGARIGQTGALTVTGAANFVADGSLVNLVLDQLGNQLLGAITMRGINGGSFVGANISSTQDLSFSGDVQDLVLNTGGLLTLGGGHNTTLTAGAKTGIVLTGPLVVSGLTTLIANGGAAMPVDLATAGAGNDLNRVELKSQSGGSFGRVQLRDGDAIRHDGLSVSGDAGSLEITSAGALDLGGGRYGGLMADTSATGAAISQTGALSVAGLTTLKAGSGSIELTRADNQFPSLTVASAGVASLVSAGDYTVNASAVSTRLQLGGPGAISLVGPLSGNGELVMSGTGQLTITTAQGYSGGTHIQSGRLVLQGQAAQAGSGDVQLGAAGELDLRDGAVLGTGLVAQGGSVLNSSGAGTLAGPVALQATTTFLPGAGGLTVTGAISDGGAGFGLRLGSAGTLTLAGSNHYSGTTDIAAGTLQANGAGALPSTSAVQLAAGAALSLGQDQAIGSLSGAGRVDLGSFTLATGADGRDTTFSGSLGGSGGLTKLGSGRFTLAGSGTHTGATHVAAGGLVLASGNALNDVTAVTVDAGATLTVQQNTSLGSLAGSGIVDLQAPLLSVGSNGSSTRFDGAITGVGGLAKLGVGVFTLAAHNTLAGDLQVNGGTLQLDGSSAVHALAAKPQAAGAVVPATAGVSVAGGATLELLSDQELGALSGSGRVLLNPYTLTLGASGRDSRFDGVISGSGALTKAGSGTLTLGGANLYTGATHVSGGTLALVAAKTLAIDSALVIDAPAKVIASSQQAVASLNGAGGLELNGASLAAGSDGRDSRFDGVISGSGGLVKQGGGAMTLTAANTNSGATVIEAGAVRLTASGSLGTGDIQNQGVLSLERSDAFTLAQAISGRGSLVVTQGQVTLANGGNSYSGATQVQGGSLITTAAERLPDASAVQVAAGAQLQLGGNETIASLQAAGSVRLAGDLKTAGQQIYTGSLTLANAAGLTLSGTLIDASRSSNQFAGTPLSLNGGQALVTVKENLQLRDVTLSEGGRIEAQRLALDGKLQLNGGSLSLVATAAPDDAKATPLGTAQVPVSGSVLAVAEATVQQGSAGVITVAESAKLQVQASGGGSVLLAQDANSFKGQLSVLSGSAYDTAWSPNTKGTQGVQSLVHVAGQQVMVGGSGIEADLVHIRADQLATLDSAKLVARLPFDEIVLGRALSAPGMTLELAPGAFGLPGSFGSITGQPIQVVVGSTETGARTTGPNAGYLTVLPKAGAQGATAVVLSGPKVGSAPASGGSGYRFFHDGASQATEIPVVYNGVLPLTPSASGAISSINGDAEDARRARFQETVRTENVTVRLRSGVIAEVGPGRPSTQGSEGVKPPELCDPAAQPPLSCKPTTP